MAPSGEKGARPKDPSELFKQFLITFLDKKENSSASELVISLTKAELNDRIYVLLDVSKERWNKLTEREKEVSIHIGNQLPTKNIAEKLNISEGTVIEHKKSIFNKLGVHSSAIIAFYALIVEMDSASQRTIIK